MESYATIYFDNPGNSQELLSFIKKIADTKYDLGYEDSSHKNNVSSISFIGGSSTEDGVEGIMGELQGKGVTFIKAYIVGDEDPWCCLFSLENNKIKSDVCSYGIYDHLSECSETEINENEELKNAHQLGPKKYFESIYFPWKVGLDAQDLEHISSQIESIIECSEDMV